MDGMASLKNPDAVKKRAARVLASRASRRDSRHSLLDDSGLADAGHAPCTGHQKQFVLPWGQGLRYHFFLSHKQQNGGQTMAWLEGKLSQARGMHSWYDNLQEDRSEAGMMAGVASSAVFLLFITEGCIERYFVQREIAEAFRLRKPICPRPPGAAKRH
jgi:hypothetical protein